VRKGATPAATAGDDEPRMVLAKKKNNLRIIKFKFTEKE
jgi:hypothetical protein